MNKKYAGLENDANGGMTPIGKLIRDAWVFNIIEKSETCTNWSYDMVSALSHKVDIEWDKYGCMVSNLPDDLKAKHLQIHNVAIKKAKNSGWTGEREINDED